MGLVVFALNSHSLRESGIVEPVIPFFSVFAFNWFSVLFCLFFVLPIWAFNNSTQNADLSASQKVKWRLAILATWPLAATAWTVFGASSDSRYLKLFALLGWLSVLALFLVTFIGPFERVLK